MSSRLRASALSASSAVETAGICWPTYWLIRSGIWLGSIADSAVASSSIEARWTQLALLSAVMSEVTNALFVDSPRQTSSDRDSYGCSIW